MADDGIKIDVEANLGPMIKSLAGIAGLVAGAFTFKQMIDNAIEAEDAVNKLNIALKLQGQFTEEASQSFQDYAANLQATTGYSDDLIVSSASLLVSIGKLSGEGLERATDAALDLAAATGKDLDTIFQLLAKSADGSTGGLAKYGIKIDESIPKSERFAAALNMINQQMGSMAEGRLNTFSGSILRLTNGFGDLLEELGKLLTKSPILRDIINYLASVFEKAAKSVEAFGKGGDFVKDVLIKSLLDLARLITQYILPPLEVLYNIGDAVFKLFKAGLQPIVVLLATVADGFGKIAGALGLMSQDSVDSLTQFRDSTVEVLGEVANDTAKAMSFTDEGLFKFDASLAADNYVTSVEEMVALSKPAIDAAKNNLNPIAPKDDGLTLGESFSSTFAGATDSMKEFAKNAETNMKKAGDSMWKTLGSGAGSAFAAFGKAVAKGENALAAFAGAFLASIGQAAIALGTNFILTGLAYSFSGNPEWEAKAGPLMAAGAALAAFGGVLSAFSGGGGETSTGGGGGGGGATGAGAASSSEGLDNIEARKPGTNLVVNIQGNVLDRRQTGLEIAEVIQETFGSNGLNFNTA